MDSTIVTLIVVGIFVVGIYFYQKYFAPQVGGVVDDYELAASKAREFVRAAEQIIQGSGPEKLRWALAMMKRYLPNLDTDQARVLIEAAVNRMNDEKGKGDSEQQ